MQQTDALALRGAARSHRRRLSMEQRRWIFCYLGLLPIVALFVVLRLIPITQTLIYSAFNSSVVNPMQNFIGLDNFRRLPMDATFRTALGNTLMFASGTVSLSVLGGLLLALMVNTRWRLTPLFETIYFLPVITPMVPVAIIWKWIYDPSYGLLNYFLSWFGVKQVGWLIYPDIALWAIVIVQVWKVLGYNMVIFLVGLRNIPGEYREAAVIDGASGAGVLRHITMPLLKPILLFVIVVTTINSFNVFTAVYVMTQGIQGTSGASVSVLVFDIWENAFRFWRTGYASAEAVILFIIVLVLTLFQFRAIRSEE
jgi:multiple sugar transport system permease protein